MSDVAIWKMQPSTLKEAMQFAELMAASDLVPKDYKGKPGNILVATQMGRELGMTPYRSLKCIAVINGRATVWGDELLAMALAFPLCEYINENESTDKAGVCTVKRKGHPVHTSVFTLDDARRAGLLGKQGPWQTNTKRMLTLRARGFALRDKFADALAGLMTTEEAIDMPQEPTIEDGREQVAPMTLKEKLKLQTTKAGVPQILDQEYPEVKAGEVEPSSLPAAESGTEPSAVPDSASEPEPDSSGEPPELEEWRKKLRSAVDSKTVNAIWRTIPEPIKQNLYGAYSDALKSHRGK